MNAISTLLQIVIDGLSAGAIYVLLALGLSIVFSVMGLINFAYGTLIVWAGYGLYLTTSLGVPYGLALVLTLIATMLLSVLIGRFAFQPFAGAAPSTLLLASFGVALSLQALAVMLFGDQPDVVPTPIGLTRAMDFGFLRISVLQVVALALGAAVLIALEVIVSHTRFGVEMRAVSEDSSTAALMGVKGNMVTTIVFLLSGFIAAVVAFIWFAQVGTVSPRADFNPTLKAFIAVVLGGLGTVRGAVIGGIVLGMIESVVAATVSIDMLAYQQAIAFALIIVVLIKRPQGIAGRVLELSK